MERTRPNISQFLEPHDPSIVEYCIVVKKRRSTDIEDFARKFSGFHSEKIISDVNSLIWRLISA